MSAAPRLESTAMKRRAGVTFAMRFGSASARKVDIVRRDVVVSGTGSTRLNDVGEDDHDGRVYDDPTRHECHAGAVKAVVVTLRGQFAIDAPPGLTPSTPAAAPPVPVDSPPPNAPPPPAESTVQPLPPTPSPAPN